MCTRVSAENGVHSRQYVKSVEKGTLCRGRDRKSEGTVRHHGAETVSGIATPRLEGARREGRVTGT